jgi:hypothetical protein
MSTLLPQEFAANQELSRATWKRIIGYGVALKERRKRILKRGKDLVVECERNGQKTLITVNNSPIFS